MKAKPGGLLDQSENKIKTETIVFSCVCVPDILLKLKRRSDVKKKAK